MISSCVGCPFFKGNYGGEEDELRSMGTVVLLG